MNFIISSIYIVIGGFLTLLMLFLYLLLSRLINLSELLMGTVLIITPFAANLFIGHNPILENIKNPSFNNITSVAGDALPIISILSVVMGIAILFYGYSIKLKQRSGKSNKD